MHSLHDLNNINIIHTVTFDIARSVEDCNVQWSMKKHLLNNNQHTAGTPWLLC